MPAPLPAVRGVNGATLDLNQYSRAEVGCSASRHTEVWHSPGWAAQPHQIMARNAFHLSANEDDVFS